MRIVFFVLLNLVTPVLFSQTHEFTLSNGLTVLVKENHRAPVAVSMIWYNVGSADEPSGTTGLSHALEHLLFKGTPTHPQGVFSKTFASLGGQINAFTSNDYTAYFEKIAAQHLETSFKLEADRMHNLIFDEGEFQKEMRVIQEERRLRTDDNPQALTFERFLATAHLASPYHHPVIGWMSDLEKMTLQDVKTWYQRYYTPNHATLVVVGDVNAQTVYKLAKRYFGSIPKGENLPRKPQQEPPALGKKSVEVHAPAQIPLLILGYTVPSIATISPEHADDPYALEVIAGLLDAGESGRLSRRLIREKQLASAADAHYNLYSRYQTQFILYATPTQHHTLDELQHSLLAELKQLQEEPVTPQELERIKNQIIAQKTFEQDSLFSQAMELGLLQATGLGWKTAGQYVERIRQVTPEQIQHAAKRYFTELNLTSARLIPQSKEAS